MSQSVTAAVHPDAPTSAALLAIGGAGLVALGLTRRSSWAGWLMLAVGGLMLRRGLAGWQQHPPKPPEPLDELELPPQPVAASPEREAELALAPMEEAPREVAEVTVLSLELLPHEHQIARERAFFLALERGGGALPWYEPEQAVRDFCHAAAEVVGRRT